MLLVLAGAAVVLLVGTALNTRPAAGTVDPVAVPDAHTGTAYAFDGAVCLSAPAGATVAEVEVQQAPGGTTRVLLPPPEARPVVAFPVEPGASGAEVADYPVPAALQDCELRLLVTPEQQGVVQAGSVRVRYRYGPGGLLRSTTTVTPPVTLEVNATGPDPRSNLL
jgi:hypothetical protein